MCTSSRLLTLSLLLVAQFAVGSDNARAVCSPLPHFLSVGNTSADARCSYDTIQDAIDNAVCADTTIIITGEHAYTAQHLTINNKSLTLTAVGPGATCASPVLPICDPNAGCTGTPSPTAPLVTISGTGFAGPSVLAITGTSNVNLQYLEITGGQRSANFTGGGIDFAGSGTLTLAVSTVTNNSAGLGGGINVSGSPGPAELRIKANTFITGNTAQDSGGGIRIAGNARLFMLEDNTFVAFNKAITGEGGGVQVLGPARADIGSPGAGGNLAVIYGNTAVNGGGVSVDAGQNPARSADLRLFSTDATRLARISNNAASNVGGGIYLKPFSVDGSRWAATLCAHDYRIDSNAALEGSAIYADADNNGTAFGDASVLLISDGSCDFPETPASLGAVSCALGASCNMIDGNSAIDINNNNQPTDGAAIFGNSPAYVFADQLMLRANSGGYALRSAGGEVHLSNCLFAENQLRHELILADSGSNLSVGNCTFANDLIGATHVVRNDSEVTLTNSIIDEAGTLALDYSGSPANLHIDYVLSNDISTLYSDPSIVQDDPLFVDGNYHLKAYMQNGVITASPAIDFAPPVTGDDRDIAGNPHDQDVGAIADRFGVRDLGAFEMQPINDRIFADGFGDPISLVY